MFSITSIVSNVTVVEFKKKSQLFRDILVYPVPSNPNLLLPPVALCSHCIKIICPTLTQLPRRRKYRNEDNSIEKKGKPLVVFPRFYFSS